MKRQPKPLGRPTSYTLEIGGEICRRIALDESLISICMDEAMPDRSTVYDWLRAHTEFSDSYARARELQAHAIADQQNELRRALLNKEIDPQTAMAAHSIGKWEAGRRLPKVYGDKVALVGGSKDDAPIRTAPDLSSLTDEQLRVLALISTR